MLGNSIQNWRFKRGQFLLLGPVLLSPHKMKLMLIAILAAFAVSVDSGEAYGRGYWKRPALHHGPRPCNDCDCDCQYSSGGCRVRQILQNNACNDHIDYLSLKFMYTFMCFCLDYNTSQQREPCLSLQIHGFLDVFRHSN